MPKIFLKSDSSLEMARYLDAPWSILYYIGRLIPKPIRDSLYDWFAARRYESLGRTDVCQRPIQGTFFTLSRIFTSISSLIVNMFAQDTKIDLLIGENPIRNMIKIGTIVAVTAT
ncbi:4918_t:CDS:2 [Paraglomus brasilianum]|uniref:4918_t:CDS:1 n=1 Tax=Paraglomus brasilianum TaxID=144538 RepID=A0A9N9CIG4_9GLOM|nr:4918_t:CDS:2 [Paraglomus brasilianum]